MITCACHTVITWHSRDWSSLKGRWDGMTTRSWRTTSTRSDKIWYLPFRVENPTKTGKICLVFDAVAKVGNTSLNSVLLKGPQQFKSLPAVLLHFREGAVGVCADIKRCFIRCWYSPICTKWWWWRSESVVRHAHIILALHACSSKQLY